MKTTDWGLLYSPRLVDTKIGYVKALGNYPCDSFSEATGVYVLTGSTGTRVKLVLLNIKKWGNFSTVQVFFFR